MAALASPSYDDPETLKALLAEDRAESLPEDQLLLGLSEAEQVEAAGFAAEESEPAKKEARRVKRRTNRGRCPPARRGLSTPSAAWLFRTLCGEVCRPA